MEDKTQILYQKLFDNGLYTKTYDDFKVKWASSPEKIGELHGVLTKEGHYTKSIEEFNEQYFPVKKKDISLLESIQKGEPLFQELGVKSDEPITPKLPYQEKEKPKTTQEDTLAEKATVSSVLKSQQRLPEYLKVEQDKIEQESIKAIQDELSKLKENYDSHTKPI